MSLLRKGGLRILLPIGVLTILALSIMTVSMQHKVSDKSHNTVVAQAKSNTSGRVLSPIPASESVFVPQNRPDIKVVSLDDIRTKVKFKVIQPNQAKLPSGHDFKGGLVVPAAYGDGYTLYYGDNIMIDASPTDLQLNIDEELAKTHQPDLSKSEEIKTLYPYSVNGIPAAGHDPFDQIMRDNEGLHTPGSVEWQVPAVGGPSKYITFSVIGEYPASELVGIAESLK